ncbi:hypothetical protein BU26DRAFT_178076 [Trematosphaeria pertusa]|uniref:Ig-like domain-containing protein n=1 Tax=Trematosphaeria pertusa TaxID=390896 RepID=A0A6A6HTT3_9PLEO|nr:uncharacterized protein BU26DRAFT_178076 [Trematosphaeria pertusa]KAF2241437.1 hypothetical protein BU26DRAFT_178076 [Trematosphaeria pertusa]
MSSLSHFFFFPRYLAEQIRNAPPKKNSVLTCRSRGLSETSRSNTMLIRWRRSGDQLKGSFAAKFSSLRFPSPHLTSPPSRALPCNRELDDRRISGRSRCPTTEAANAGADDAHGEPVPATA